MGREQRGDRKGVWKKMNKRNSVKNRLEKNEPMLSFSHEEKIIIVTNHCIPS